MKRFLPWCLVLLVSFFQSASQATTPIDFSLSLNQNSLNVYDGSSGTIIFSSSTSSSTSYRLHFSLAGLPTGATVTFSSNDVPPGSSLSFRIADSGAGLSLKTPVSLVARRSTDGAAISMPFTVNFLPKPGTLPAVRNQFLDTQGTPVAIAVSPSQNLLFASVWPNHVQVLNLAAGTLVKSIAVSTPEGLDLSPDGKTLVVGGAWNQIVLVDVATLKITRRMLLPKLGPSWTFMTSRHALMLANGKVLLMDQGRVALADPASGTTVARFQLIQIASMMRSGDGMKVLLSDGGSRVYLYDVMTDTYTSSTAYGAVIPIAASRDGLFVAYSTVQKVGAPESSSVLLLDSTLARRGSLQSCAAKGVFSPDESELYIPCGTTIRTLDAASLQLKGMAPYAAAESALVPGGNQSLDVSFYESDLFYVICDGGVAVEDPNNHSSNLILRTDAAAAPTFNPAQAKLNATRSTSWPGVAFNFVPDVWFGATRALTQGLNAGQLVATAPASSVGQVVTPKLVLPTGEVWIRPLGFSYGVQPTAIVGTAASANGGAKVTVLGRGLVDPSGATTVTVAGNSAQSSASAPFGSGLQTLQVTVPPGTPGPAPIRITSPVGSATVNGFRYVQSEQWYSSGAPYNAVLYDRARRVVYASRADRVDVFSTDTHQFLTPIVPPTLSGAMSLQGMALTPDGGKLLVADRTDGSLAVVDLQQRSHSYAIAVTSQTSTGVPGPFRVAATAIGTAFVVAKGGDGVSSSLYDVSLASRTAAKLSGSLSAFTNGDVSSSLSGGRVVVSADSNEFAWNSSTLKWTQRMGASTLAAAVSGDGHVWAAGRYLLDSSIRLLGYAAQPAGYEVAGYCQAERMNDSGSLLYVAADHAVDIIDVNRSQDRDRVLLHGDPSIPVARGMDIDGDGSRIFLVTSDGLTIVQLDRVPISIATVAPFNTHIGSIVSLSGSGFAPNVSVTVNGVATTWSYLSPTKARIQVPPTSGPAEIVLTTTDGQRYSLEAAMNVQLY